MNPEQPNINQGVLDAFRYQYHSGIMSEDTVKDFVPFMYNQAACDAILEQNKETPAENGGGTGTPAN